MKERLFYRQRWMAAGLGSLGLCLVAFCRQQQDDAASAFPDVAASATREVSTPRPSLPVLVEERGIEIATCPGSSDPTQVIAWGEESSVSGASLVPCLSVRKDTVECVFPHAGRWMVVQGGFQGVLDVSPGLQDALQPIKAIVCDAGCSLSLSVSTDGCSDVGEFELVATLNGGYPEIKTVTKGDWAADQSLVISDLPCSPMRVRARGGDCKEEAVTIGVESIRESLSMELIALSWLEICVVDVNTGTPVPDATILVEFDYIFVNVDATGCAFIARPAIQRAGASIKAPGYAPARVQIHPKSGDRPYEEVSLTPTTPTRVRCLDGGAPCPSGTRVRVKGVAAFLESRECRHIDNEVWDCPVIGSELVSVWYKHQQSRPVAIEAGRDGMIVYLPALDGLACFRWEEEGVESCKLRVAQDDNVNGSQFFEGDVLSGVPFSLPSSIQQLRRSLLLCDSHYWLGKIQLQSAGSESCQAVELRDTGEVCMNRAKECGMMAGGLEDSPDQLFGYHKIQSCVGGLPPGLWTVSCGRESKDRAGVVVEEGTTVDAVFPQ